MKSNLLEPLLAAVPAIMLAAQDASSVWASAQAPSDRARVPVLTSGPLTEWRVHGRRSLSFAGPGDRWYYAELTAPCVGLSSATRIVYTKRPGTTVDRHGTIFLRNGNPRGQSCGIKTLVETEKPVDAGDHTKVENGQS
ncbi:MAG: DUF6491 family protein [Rhodospirillaceae bacterium]|nr:DUF6491 family protein [Rhodospirillaceae bacterium]